MLYFYLKPTSYGKMGPGEIGPSTQKNPKSEKGIVSFIFGGISYEWTNYIGLKLFFIDIVFKIEVIHTMIYVE